LQLKSAGETAISFSTGGIFWTKFEPTLNKIPTPNSDLCGCLRQPHTHPPPKTGGRAKIPSPKTPSFLPARFYPLRGRAVAFLGILNYYNYCTKIKNGVQHFSHPVIKELLFVASVLLF
jgi:hypothetical protein